MGLFVTELVLGVIVVGCLFWGLHRERSAFLVPHLVWQVFNLFVTIFVIIFVLVLTFAYRHAILDLFRAADLHSHLDLTNSVVIAFGCVMAVIYLIGVGIQVGCRIVVVRKNQFPEIFDTRLSRSGSSSSSSTASASSVTNTANHTAPHSPSPRRPPPSTTSNRNQSKDTTMRMAHRNTSEPLQSSHHFVVLLLLTIRQSTCTGPVSGVHCSVCLCLCSSDYPEAEVDK